jgi:hypothetical protein
MKKAMVLFAGVGALALAPALCGAQVVKGKLRLGLDMRLMGFTAATTDYDNADLDDTKTRAFTLGVGNPQLGVGVGYSVIDGLVIGARFALGFSSTKSDPDGAGNNDKYRTFDVVALPYVEYAFDLGKRVAPFLIAALGYECFLVKDISYEDDNDPYGKDVTNLFVFGAGGGAHFFLVDAFSLDASLLAFGGVGGGKAEDGDDNDSHAEDRSLRSFDLELLFGFSGWI